MHQSRSIRDVDTRQKIEISADVQWIEITDVTHPLLGKRFAVISLSQHPGVLQSVLVQRPDGGTLRLPLRQTSLSVLVDHSPHAKLSTLVAQEFLNLVKEYELWPLTKPVKSGPQSTKISDKKSPTKSNK